METTSILGFYGFMWPMLGSSYLKELPKLQRLAEHDGTAWRSGCLSPGARVPLQFDRLRTDCMCSRAPDHRAAPKCWRAEI